MSWILNELPEVKVVLYYPSGKLMYKYSLIDGERNGKWDEWYENGQKKISCFYEDNCAEGMIKEWHEDGKKKSIEKLINRKYEGQRITWYKNGQKRWQLRYLDGKKNGTEFSWYEDGKREFQRKYLDGKKDGCSIEWYENGNKKKIKYYKEGLICGLIKIWYENGSKKSEVSIQNRQKNGKFILWYKSGTKKEEGEYLNHNRYGLWTFWNKNGQKTEEKRYNEEGNLDGEIICWYDNGQMKSKEIRQDETPIGIGNGWYPDGKLKSQMTHQGNNIFYQDWYHNGVLDREGKVIYSRKEGLWKLYHDNGNIKQEINYKCSMMHGHYIEYSFEGEKIAEGEYILGGRHGKWLENGKIVNYKHNKIIEYGMKISGTDIFGNEFIENVGYRKCTCIQKTHYFTDESWRSNDKDICPFDFSKIHESVFVGEESFGSIQVDHSEVIAE